MKQKMKSLVSIIMLILMMVSMFSVCVFPASAATGDEYTYLQTGALVVNTAWADKQEGDEVTYYYRGKKIVEPFEAEWHFASFADAWDYAASTNRKNPTIMIVGKYAEEISIKGSATIIGANAGIDPIVETPFYYKESWSLSESFIDDSVINGNVIIENVAEADVVFDGITFGNGSAYFDKYRSSGESLVTFKNVLFDEAGNAASSYYAMDLTAEGHSRSIYLENVFITGQNSKGFISPYFVKFVAKHIAYVNNGQGILNDTAFSAGVAPYVEFTDSCFFNSSTPSVPVISIANSRTGFNFNINGVSGNRVISSSDQRPSSLLTIRDCIFRNASSDAGLIQYEFVSKNSTFSFTNNYVWSNSPSGTTILDPKFVIDSANIDQTSCMYIRNNRLIGAYKIPDVSAGHKDTRIDMSYNFFGNTSYQCVERPVYVNPEKPRLIRSAFWISEAMDVSSADPMWEIDVKDWSMYQIDTFGFEVVLTAFEETGVAEFLPKFIAKNGSTIALYKNADDVNGRYVNLSDPIDQLTMADLKDDPYEPTVIYAKITNRAYSFAPVYRIVLDNVGSIDSAKPFSEAYPGFYMYQPTVAKNAVGSTVPYRWQGEIYKFEVNKNLFADMDSLIAYAKSKGDEIPNVVIPAGVYTDELTIPGSCTILGEKHGIDPNVVVADVITKENVATSGWTLNPERSNDKYETIFKNACIRVPAGVEDYIITIDGIKMGEGCSYVDDEVRSNPVTNVTIFRNVIADGAGGGLDRSGASNLYLFNFNKPAGSGEIDEAHVYLYNSRIVRNQKCHVFGPYIEKLIVDHTYFGDAKTDPVTGNHNFLMNFRSRGVHSPYYGLTNNCWFNNEKSSTNSDGLTGTYIINTTDHQADQAVKKNIIYNIDNNYFWNGFGSGNAAFQIYFTGSTMKVFLTNNIMVSSAITGGDTFFAGNANTRWSGDAASYDCSDQIICKGNRMVGRVQIPHTAGTGNGTMIDYSGNYFAKKIGDAPLQPDKLDTATGRDFTKFPTEAYYTKYKVDYTYLDWDMTQRSDVSLLSDAAYALNKGMYGTGGHYDVLFEGKTQTLFHDIVTGECKKYEVPATIPAHCKMKIEKRTGENTYVSATSMVPGAGETVFRVTVTSNDSAATVKEKSFIVKLYRALNHKAELLSMDGSDSNEHGFVDKDTQTVYFYSNKATFNYIPDLIETSYGATAALYSDAACTTPVSGAVNLKSTGAVDLYLKVTSENKNVSSVYNLKLIQYSNAKPINLAAMNGTTGATETTYLSGGLFEAFVSEWYPEAEFKLDLFKGATAKVYRGNALLTAKSGKYTVEDIKEGETLRVEVTAADGVATKTYQIVFKYEASDQCELLNIEGAIKTKAGFFWNLGFAQAAKLSAEVSEGATYQAYDADMKPFEGNVVYLTEGTGTRFYLGVTAENGKNTKLYKIDLATQANVGFKPAFSVKANGKTYPAYLTAYKEYTAYLPDDVASVQIDYSKAPNTSLYTGADHSIILAEESKINLKQKITTFHYIKDASTDRTVEFEGETLIVRDMEEMGVLHIVSDRKVATYKDANKIPGWARPAVNALNEGGYGLMVGDSKGNFNPNADISRYELAVIAVGIMGLDVNQFANVQLNYADKIEGWALPYVRAVTSVGLMSGNDVKGMLLFNGNGTATREQVAVVMSQIVLLGKGLIQPMSAVAGIYATPADYFAKHKNELSTEFDNAKFKDLAQVSSWALPSMKMAVHFGIIGGSADKGGLKLNPKANITRAEVAVMAAGYLTK